MQQHAPINDPARYRFQKPDLGTSDRTEARRTLHRMRQSPNSGQRLQSQQLVDPCQARSNLFLLER
jgi:hypothetical protein